MKTTINTEVLEQAIELLSSAQVSTANVWKRHDVCEELRAALAAQQEPDWKHPKIQALIGRDAHKSIQLRLIEQLLENPEFETTALDMEYWDSTHDKLREALTAQPTAPVVPQWQPIETAPKGGITILLWVVNAYMHSHVKTGFMNDGIVHSYFDDGEEAGYIVEEFATHWLPLPDLRRT